MKLAIFLQQSFLKYKDTYDYSKVKEFTNKKLPVTIICKTHGDFLQSPYHHLKNQYGCKKCAIQFVAKKKTTLIENFINKCKLKHDNKYDYSLVKFKTLKDTVSIICPIHGVFETKANIHLKCGCAKCRDDKLRNNINGLILKANKIHNNKYDYSKVTNYTNNKQKINIICKEHGEFVLQINSHLSGRGCFKCYKNNFQLNSFNSFVEKSNIIHNFNYDYSKINIDKFNANIKVLIICKKHGEFKQRAIQHLNGSNCPKCTKENRRLTLEEFLKQAKIVHGDKYDYSKVKFNFVSDKIQIECYKHGKFFQRVASHLYSKTGCPNCSKIISKAETEWLDYLNIPLEFRNKKIILNNKIFFPDGLDPNTKTFYEYYGDYWHGNLNVYSPEKINKLNKTKFIDLYNQTIERENFIKSNGYNIVSIWESDWNKIKANHEEL